MLIRKTAPCVTAFIGIFLGSCGWASAAEFETARIHLEQNVVDEDAEAVITIKGGDEGLRTIRVIAPDRRRITAYESRNRRNLGAREMLIETPEPSLATVLAAYPEGTYRFIGHTFDGEELLAEAVLSHEFADAVAVTFPENEAEDVPLEVTLLWEPVAEAVGYFVEIEQEDLEIVIETNIPAPASSFALPAGWLRPGLEYVVGIGSISENGNVTFIESTFTTID